MSKYIPRRLYGSRGTTELQKTSRMRNKGLYHIAGHLNQMRYLLKEMPLSTTEKVNMELAIAYLQDIKKNSRDRWYNELKPTLVEEEPIDITL